MTHRIARFVFPLLCLVCFAFSLPAAAGEVGKVGRIAGAPTVARGGQTLPLGSGMGVEDGDRIVTNEQARLEIQCKDGTILVIGPGTDLTLGTFAALSGKRGQVGALELLHGIVRIALAAGARWDRFAVTTRTAIASVRSTVWIVDATAETTGVFVIDGRVRVASRSGKGQVDVAAGLGTDVAAGAAPTAPKPWAHGRVESITARTKFAD